MNKDALLQKLQVLQQQSQDTINQINENEKHVQDLREQALIIKGEYQAIQKLIAELTESEETKKKDKV